MSEPPRPPRPFPSGDPQDPNAGQYPPGRTRTASTRRLPPPAGAETRGPMGARLARRPEARFGTSLAAAGAALVIGGVLVWGFGYLFDGCACVDANRVPSGPAEAAVLGVLAVARPGGRRLRARPRSGAAAPGHRRGGGRRVRRPAAAAVPVLRRERRAARALPFSVDAIYLVSIAVWLVSYFARSRRAGPGVLPRPGRSRLRQLHRGQGGRQRLVRPDDRHARQRLGADDARPRHRHVRRDRADLRSRLLRDRRVPRPPRARLARPSRSCTPGSS